jgi:hypothetical protein
MITKIQQFKAPTDETVSIEVIPSGMTLTLKTTLKSPDYNLETLQDIPFTTPLSNKTYRIYMVNNPLDPIEILEDNAEPTQELVMDICSFTLTPLDVDLANVDITVLEVI